MGATLGPALAAIIGGLLNQCLGWRFIFGFLTIFVGIMMLLTLLCFPETSRSVVGNGSILPQKWNISALDLIKWHRQRNSGVQVEVKRLWREREDQIRLTPSRSHCRRMQAQSSSLVRYCTQVSSQCSAVFFHSLKKNTTSTLSKSGSAICRIALVYLASVFIRAYGWVIISRLASLVRC